jgi:hypothetical protein
VRCALVFVRALVSGGELVLRAPEDATPLAHALAARTAFRREIPEAVAQWLIDRDEVEDLLAGDLRLVFLLARAHAARTWRGLQFAEGRATTLRAAIAFDDDGELQGRLEAKGSLRGTALGRWLYQRLGDVADIAHEQPARTWAVDLVVLDEACVERAELQLQWDEEEGAAFLGSVARDLDLEALIETFVGALVDHA